MSSSGSAPRVYYAQRGTERLRAYTARSGGGLGYFATSDGGAGLGETEPGVVREIEPAGG